MKIATFFAGNRLSVENAERILTHYNYQRTNIMLRSWRIKMKKILDVMNYVKRDVNRDRYDFFDMRRREILWFNYEPRKSL